MHYYIVSFSFTTKDMNANLTGLLNYQKLIRVFFFSHCEQHICLLSYSVSSRLSYLMFTNLTLKDTVTEIHCLDYMLNPDIFMHGQEY